MNKVKKAAAWVLSALMTATSLISPVFSADYVPGDGAPDGYKGVNITHHSGAYNFHNAQKYTYTFDFSMSRKSYYTVHEALSLGNENNMIVDDGTLRVKSGKTLMFGSSVGLGDDYGLEPGEASFDLKINGGKLYLGVRTSKTAVTNEARGLWFGFDGTDVLSITEPECGFEAKVKIENDFSSAEKVKIYDNVDSLSLYIGEKNIVEIKYGKDGHLEVFDADKKSIASTDKCKLYTSGYVQLYLDSLDGYVDNFSFTHAKLDDALYTDGSRREIDYSTWIATDDLGRTTSTGEKAGKVKEDKQVGLFYFLCWVGAGQVVQDNTKLYLDRGIDGLKSFFSDKKGGEAYWAEPYFGYYLNTDEWVYRKHAYMLEAAGVDFIFLDVSNNEVFINGHMTLFDTWLKIRQEGGMTPQIMFMTGDTSSTFESDMRNLFNTVYSDDNWDKYSELFYYVDGKPLVFGNISDVSPEMAAKINDKFTVRGCWAWCDKDGYWSWLQEYSYDESKGTYGLVNGGWGRDLSGKHEALAISMGHHPTTNKGRSFVYGTQPKNNKGDFEFSSVKQSGLGLNFESQFKAAKALDPQYLLITGWNEWIAGCNYTASAKDRTMFANSKSTFYYVDQFNCEFSRDGEPMRNSDGYGIGDNYYYQMVDYIRQFKGMEETPVADNQQSIDIYDVKEWNNISLEYRDNIGDTKLRNSSSYDRSYRYINNTGRNDFDYAKVSQDSENIYFMAKCVNDIIIDDGKNWMNLYINTDGDNATGWGGYDYVINRDRDSYVVSVEKFKDNSWDGEIVGVAEYYLEGKYIVIKINKGLMGLKGTVKELLFKWADNSTENGDLMAFMDTGDAAPNDRYSFIYKAESCSDNSFDKSKTPVINDPVIKRPDGDIDIGNGDEIDSEGKRVVNIEFNFEDFRSGMSVDKTTVNDIFQLDCGSSTSSAMIINDKGNNYVHHKGFVDLRTWYDIEGDYTFSVDLNLAESGNSAVYVRGEMPGIFKPYNPAHSSAAGKDIYQVLNYYEWDWYQENGGNGASSVAGSGLGIYPGQDSLLLKFKKYVSDGLTIASTDITIPYPEALEGREGFFNLKVTDNSERMDIYINNVLISYVLLENPGVSYESDKTGSKYYGKIEVYDSEDNKLGELENTRLNSNGSQIALTTRNQTMYYDNIFISFKEKAPEIPDVKVEKIQNAKPGDFTPSKRLANQYKTVLSEEDTTDTEDDTAVNETSDGDVSNNSGGCKKGCKSSTGFALVIPFAAAFAIGMKNKKDE